MSAEVDEIRFDEKGLVPAVVQDAATGEVLMVAYMNAESLRRTIATGLTHFYSRSRGRVWQKGEDSGHVQRVREILYDCDSDTLLIKAEQEGVACHTGHRSCFFRRLHPAPEGSPEIAPVLRDPGEVYGEGMAVLEKIFAVIQDRRENRPPGSYVADLFAAGQDQILKKAGEECAELLLASKNGKADEIIYEAADLVFHTLVLLAFHGISPREVTRELARRFGKKKEEYRRGDSPGKG